MADQPICPCNGAPSQLAIFNLPGRDRLDYRIGDFVSFRHALLRSVIDPPLGPESELGSWKPDTGGDFGVQMLEWWAYLADILAFYNERIANETYLRTATLPESVRRLVRTIGYRPRPGIAARGTLVALAGGHRALTLPRGFSLDSKPGPGQRPQTFELDADTVIAPANTVAARPTTFPLSPATTALYVAGSNLPVAVGEVLLMRRAGDPSVYILDITAKQIDPTAASPRTRLTFTTNNVLPVAAAASELELLRSTQTAAVSTLDGSALSGSTIHLASLSRDLHAGDYVVLTAFDQALKPLRRITAISDALWYANHLASGPGDAPAAPEIPIAIPHSVLTLDSEVPSGWSNDKTTVRFLWRSAGTLLDQPVMTFTGAPPATLSAQAPATFPADAGLPVVISDSIGQGMAAFGSPGNGGAILAASGFGPQPVTLKPPLTVHYNLLAVSRGKTVLNEILGSGDAGIAGQQFVLKKGPLTYIAKGDSYASTLAVSVNGRRWQEAKSFYRQPPDAEIFVTREDEQQNTRVLFGDGVNGARLPTGIDNVLATYRYGSGASSPRAGEITVINKPYPNLKAVQNPVAVGSGADPDPPNQIRRLAPATIMTFGRAVSANDYEVIAARAPGVTRARAVWSFDAIEQRAAVKIYVTGDAGAEKSARDAIAVTGDPHRHVVVTAAAQLPVLLGLPVRIDGRFQLDDVKAALRQALLDEERGLFGTRRLGIGQAVFDSEIAAACHACEGVVALRHVLFIVGWSSGSAFDTAARHVPGEGAVFALDAEHLFICPEVADAG
jgi:hypothetical protein